MTQEWKRAVARVWVEDSAETRRFIGSAFLVSMRQLITCRHVLEGHDEQRIYVSGPAWTGVQRILTIIPHPERDVCLMEFGSSDDCVAAPLEPWKRPPNSEVLEQELTLAGYTSRDGALETPTMRLRAYDGVLNTWVLHTHLSKGFSGGPALIGNTVFGVVQAREIDGAKTYVIPLEATREFLLSNGIWNTSSNSANPQQFVSNGGDRRAELTQVSLSLFSRRDESSSRLREIVTLPARRAVIGREHDIQIAENHLRHLNKVVLVGGRGVGKSTVGLELAHRARENARNGGGAFLFFSCRSESYGRDELCDCLALQLDYPAVANASGSQKRALLLQVLGKARFPIVLLIDDLESLSDRQEEVLEFLQSLPSSTRVIITTSERHKNIQAFPQVEITGMHEQESIAFIRSEIANRHIKGLSGLDELFLTRIHAVTGGTPLVMQWILGQAGQGFAIGSVLSFLERGLQESISAKLFTKSWEAMSEVTRRALTLTTLFSGDSATYFLRNLLDTHDDMLLPAVEEMRRYCMAELEPGGPLLGERITVHPLVVQFVKNNAVDQQHWLQEKKTRLVELYIELLGANREVAASGEIVRELEGELQNVLWLIEKLKNEGDTTASAELSLAIEDFLNLFGLYDVRIRLSRSAADQFRTIGMYEKASHMLTVAAGSYLSRGQYQEALELTRKSIELATEANSDAELSRALRVVGIVQFFLEGDHAARTSLEQAWPLAERAHDVESLVELCFLEANLAVVRSGYKEVRVALDRALSLAESIGWRRPKGYAAGLLARVAMEEGKMAEALTQLDIGEKIAMDYSDRRLFGRISLLRCSALARMGAYREFRNRLREVIGLLERLGMRGELQEARAQELFWHRMRRFGVRVLPWAFPPPPVRYDPIRLDGI